MIDPLDLDSVLSAVQEQVAEENVRVTQHAQREMAEEEITHDVTPTQRNP